MQNAAIVDWIIIIIWNHHFRLVLSINIFFCKNLNFLVEEKRKMPLEEGPNSKNDRIRCHYKI